MSYPISAATMLSDGASLQAIFAKGSYFVIVHPEGRADLLQVLEVAPMDLGTFVRAHAQDFDSWSDAFVAAQDLADIEGMTLVDYALDTEDLDTLDSFFAFGLEAGD